MKLLPLHKKLSFPLKISLGFLVTFTEEILDGKLHFLCSVLYYTETINKDFVKITKKLYLKPTETKTETRKLSELVDWYKDQKSIDKIRSQMNGEK